MELGRHTGIGAAQSSSFHYVGRHQVFQMDAGVGLIAHGDRDRVKPEYNTIEERDSIDAFTKYIGLS